MTYRLGQKVRLARDATREGEIVALRRIGGTLYATGVVGEGSNVDHGCARIEVAPRLTPDPTP